MPTSERLCVVRDRRSGLEIVLPKTFVQRRLEWFDRIGMLVVEVEFDTHADSRFTATETHLHGEYLVNLYVY